MTDFKNKFASFQGWSTGAITSVASGSGIVDGYENAPVDNQTTGYDWIELYVDAAMSNTGTLAGDKQIYVYAYDVVVGSSDLRPGNLTGNTAALAAVNTANLKFLGTIPVAAINDPNVNRAFKIYNPGPKWAPVYVNACGASGPTATITTTWQGKYAGTA